MVCGLRARISAVVTAVVITCGGCATYQQPADGVAAAEVNILNTPPKPGTYYTQHSFIKVQNDTCTPRLPLVYIGKIGMVYGGNTKAPVKITANERIYILASGNAGTALGYGVLMAECNNLFSFIPEAGHIYDLSQRFYSRECAVTLKDQVTGLPPPSYQVHPIIENCGHI